MEQTTYTGNVVHKVTTSKHKNLIMGNRKDSVIDHDFISDNLYLYQSHLERISDYLLLDDSWEINQKGVVFKVLYLNVSKIYENTLKHNFRYVFI